MPIFRITTSLDTVIGTAIDTPHRDVAIREYCKLVKKSYAMNGASSGQSVEMHRDEVRVLEHFGRKELSDRVASRLIALDSVPDDNNPLDL